MGMFDYVKCERTLPDGWDLTNDHVGLQTKDFDCTMTTIKITEDGRLMILDFEHEEVPKAERRYPNDEGLLGMIGCLRRVNERWRDLSFHGVMSFYGLEDLKDDYWVASTRPDGGYWQKRYRDHDYEAKFTDGQLVGLTAVTE